MKPIGRIIQPNLFPEVLPTVNTARPEFQWLIPYDEACKLPANTLLYMEEHAVEERKYHRLLQRVGLVLNFLPGDNLMTDVVPRVQRLQTRNTILQDELDNMYRRLNAFAERPWYVRAWRVMRGLPL